MNEVPKNAGKPFTDADDTVIRTGFCIGATVTQLAVTLERTTAGIQARLERLGLVKAGKVTKAQNRMLASN